MKERSSYKDAFEPAGSIITTIQKDNNSIDSKPTIVCLGIKGERVRPPKKPPRNSSFTVGVLKDGGAMISYLKSGGRGLDGYHNQEEKYITTHYQQQLEAIAHGSVLSEEGRRVVKIYAMHPDDIATLGGFSALTQGLDQEGSSYERGIVEPSRYITGDTAQAVINYFQAERLDIVYGRRSSSIYQFT